MWRIRRKFLLSIFLIYFCSSVYCQNKINNTIECSWLEYDYGVLNIGETASCTLVIKNISDHRFIIEQIINGCSCISAEINKKCLRPKGVARIKIKFNSAGKSPGEIYQNIAIYTSDEKFYSFIIKATLNNEVEQ